MAHKIKRNSFFFIVSLSICLFSNCERYSARNDDNDDPGKYYYWSANKKIFVTVQKGAYIIKLNEGVTIAEIGNRLYTNEYSYVSDNLATLYKLDLTLNELKSTQGINNAIYRFKIGESPFDLTGEILLKPKQGVEISELLKIIDNRATVQEQTKYNTFVLYTDDWDKLFDYSNRLYESKLVDYSHPNFRAVINFDK